MIPMPGKIIVKQDGGSEQRGGILVSQRFAEKDRPMTGRVLAVGAGKPCEVFDAMIQELVEQAYAECPHVDTRRAISDVCFQVAKATARIQREQRPVSVKAGDRVVFRVFAGDGIEWTDGSMCRCLTEEDVLARIED